MMTSIAARFVHIQSTALQIEGVDSPRRHRTMSDWLARRAQRWQRMEGVQIALDMEHDIAWFQGDARAVAVLDGFWAYVIFGIQHASRDWVIANEVRPTLACGTSVEFSKEGRLMEGQIIGIDLGEGRYRVTHNDKLDDENPDDVQCDLYLPYESVTLRQCLLEVD